MPLEFDPDGSDEVRLRQTAFLRAKLVRRAEAWEFSSLAARALAGNEQPVVPLAAWPVPRQKDWVECVNRPVKEAEVERLRTSVRRGRPFGDDVWARETARKLGLEHTFRDAGRPRMATTNPVARSTALPDL